MSRQWSRIRNKKSHNHSGLKISPKVDNRGLIPDKRRVDRETKIIKKVGGRYLRCSLESPPTTRRSHVHPETGGEKQTEQNVSDARNPSKNIHSSIAEAGHDRIQGTEGRGQGARGEREPPVARKRGFARAKAPEQKKKNTKEIKGPRVNRPKGGGVQEEKGGGGGGGGGGGRRERDTSRFGRFSFF